MLFILTYDYQNQNSVLIEDYEMKQNRLNRGMICRVGSRMGLSLSLSLSSYSVKAAIWWWTPPSKPEPTEEESVSESCMMLC